MESNRTGAKSTGRGKAAAYRQVAERLRRDIAAGRFPDGRLPPERLLHRQLGVGIITLKRAMQELVREDLVYRRRGHGTFIKDWHRGARPRLRRTDTICYISGAGSERAPGSFFNRLLLACQEEAERMGFSLLLAGAGEGRLPPALRQRRADVVLLAGTFRPASAFGTCPPDIEQLNMRFLRCLAGTGLPVVSISNHGSWPGVHRVLPDYAGAVRRVLAELRRLGHERIGLWGGPFDWPPFRARRDAFLLAAKECGLRLESDDYVLEFPHFAYLDMPALSALIVDWLQVHREYSAALLVSGAPVLAARALAAAGRENFRVVALADNPPPAPGQTPLPAPDEEVPTDTHALVMPVRTLAAAAVGRAVELAAGRTYTEEERTLLVGIPFQPGSDWETRFT